MKKMIIIEIEKGSLQGVYTDSLDDFEVRLKDADVRDDDEDEFQRLSALINKGAARDIWFEPMNPSEAKEPRMPDSKVFALIRELDTAKTESGRCKQREFATFIDGYLTASTELSAFLFSLRKTNDEEGVKLARDLAQRLQALRSRQSENFDRLCDYLNTAELFDPVEKSADEQELQ